MRPQTIELIKDLLNEKEIAVAKRLDYLIEKEPEMWKAWTLLEQVLPVFWRKEGGHLYTIAPTFVYRTLYYLNHPHDFRRNPRYMIFMMGNHLEGLLSRLLGLHNRPLGDLSHYLSRLNQGELKANLLKFNVVYTKTKHMSGDPFLESRLDLRTFSTLEAIYCLFIVRHLSIKLFDLLKEVGKPLKEEWKLIDPEWIKWDSEEPVSPGRDVIPCSEPPET